MALLIKKQIGHLTLLFGINVLAGLERDAGIKR
jgi:hypothetical protein